jgi:segregation and condensation protein B
MQEPNYLQQHIEALVFCATEPITLNEIKACLSEMFDAEVPAEHIEAAINELLEKYKPDTYTFQMLHLGGGYKFMTKPAYQAGISLLLKQQSRKRLSTSAVETLSIIAYKQPVTKAQLEQIRGVNCDYALQKLLDRSLVEIKGKAETAGRPLLYGTGKKFMEYFGINSLTDLPQPKDVAPEETELPMVKPE